MQHIITSFFEKLIISDNLSHQVYIDILLRICLFSFLLTLGYLLITLFTNTLELNNLIFLETIFVNIYFNMFNYFNTFKLLNST